jgi:hypothetical protein
MDRTQTAGGAFCTRTRLTVARRRRIPLESRTPVRTDVRYVLPRARRANSPPIPNVPLE